MASTSIDKALMHNTLTQSLYRDLGHYSSRTRFLEVYLKVDAGTAGPVTTADLLRAVRAGREDQDRQEPRGY